MMQETWILKKMVGPLLLAGSFGGLMLATVIAGSKRNKRKNVDNSSTHSSQSEDAPDDIEVAAPRRKSKPALKKEVGGNSVTPTKDHYCRFCKMKFDKSQALGGHMNRHRQERENEELQKAKDLITHREQQYGGPLWSMQGPGAGSLHHGGNLLPNTPVVGASSRPYFPPNQPTSPLQNWQFNQLLTTQQTSYSLQSQSQAGGSYCSSQDNARPHQGLPLQPLAQHTSEVQHPAHQQLRVNPGQQLTGHVIQSGADIGAGLQSYGPSSFQVDQAGPSPLEEIVLGSTNPRTLQSNNSMSSFIQRSSQSNIQFMDPYGNIPPNSRLPPLNETYFQPGQGQGHTFQVQHYPYYQKPGTSAMGGLGSNDANQSPNQAYNQTPGSGILHMSSFQDSTDQDDYQGGNDRTTAVELEAGQASLEGSPDVSSDEKLQR